MVNCLGSDKEQRYYLGLIDELRAVERASGYPLPIAIPDNQVRQRWRKYARSASGD